MSTELGMAGKPERHSFIADCTHIRRFYSKAPSSMHGFMTLTQSVTSETTYNSIPVPDCDSGSSHSRCSTRNTDQYQSMY